MKRVFCSFFLYFFNYSGTFFLKSIFLNFPLFIRALLTNFATDGAQFALRILFLQRNACLEYLRWRFQCIAFYAAFCKICYVSYWLKFHLLKFLKLRYVLTLEILFWTHIVLIYEDLTILTVCSYHVTYAFLSESTLYSCLNVTEFLVQSRREIWSLSDYNWTRTHNHLVHKRTLNHLAKWFVYEQMVRLLSVRLWTKWLWVRAQLQSDNPVKDIRFKKVYRTIGQNESHATWIVRFFIPCWFFINIY